MGNIRLKLNNPVNYSLLAYVIFQEVEFHKNLVHLMAYLSKNKLFMSKSFELIDNSLKLEFLNHLLILRIQTDEYEVKLREYIQFPYEVFHQSFPPKKHLDLNFFNQVKEFSDEHVFLTQATICKNLV